MPSQEATNAAALNAAPLSLLLTVLFMVVLAMCGPSAICVPKVMIDEGKRLPGNVRPLIPFPFIPQTFGRRRSSGLFEPGLTSSMFLSGLLELSSSKLTHGGFPGHRTLIRILTLSPLNIFLYQTQIWKHLGFRLQRRRWGWGRRGGCCERRRNRGQERMGRGGLMGRNRAVGGRRAKHSLQVRSTTERRRGNYMSGILHLSSALHRSTFQTRCQSRRVPSAYSTIIAIYRTVPGLTVLTAAEPDLRGSLIINNIISHGPKANL